MAHGRDFRRPSAITPSPHLATQRRFVARSTAMSMKSRCVMAILFSRQIGNRRSHGGGNPSSYRSQQHRTQVACLQTWVPACAGTTVSRLATRLSGRRNDGAWARLPSTPTITPSPHLASQRRFVATLDRDVDEVALRHGDLVLPPTWKPSFPRRREPKFVPQPTASNAGGLLANLGSRLRGNEVSRLARRLSGRRNDGTWARLPAPLRHHPITPPGFPAPLRSGARLRCR